MTRAYQWSHKDWGVIPKCPHCERTDITRIAKNQVTCGQAACRRAQASRRTRKSQKKP